VCVCVCVCRGQGLRKGGDEGGGEGNDLREGPGGLPVEKREGGGPEEKEQGLNHLLRHCYW
jgi:hypothetical protein